MLRVPRCEIEVFMNFRGPQGPGGEAGGPRYGNTASIVPVRRASGLSVQRELDFEKLHVI